MSNLSQRQAARIDKQEEHTLEQLREMLLHDRTLRGKRLDYLLAAKGRTLRGRRVEYLLAAKALRAAADWWEAKPRRFLQEEFERKQGNEIVAMCSMGNIYFHTTGRSINNGFARGSANARLEMAAGLACREVAALGGHSHDLDICQLNNASVQTQMCGYFRRAAHRLETEA